MLYILQDHGSSRDYLGNTGREVGGNAPWMGCRFIAGHHAHTFSHSFSARGLFAPTAMFLVVGRQPENLEDTHTDTGRTCTQ